VEEQMSQYLYSLNFQGDDNNMQRKAILAEAQNLIDEHLEVEDLNILEARQPIHHNKKLVIWRFQMQMTSQKIEGYLKQNDYNIGMITRGVQKTTVFLDEAIDSYDLIEEEWNIAFAANTGSNLV